MAKEQPKQIKREFKKDLKALAIATFGLLSFVSLVVTRVNPQYLSGEAIGAVGRFLVRSMLGLFGSGRFVFTLLITYWGIQMFRKIDKEELNNKVLATSIFLLIFLCILHLSHLSDAIGFSELMKQSLAGHGGGLIGAFLAYILFFFFGRVGSYLVLLFVGLGGLVVLGIPDLRGGSGNGGSIPQKIRRVFSKAKKKLIDFLFVEVEVEDDDGGKVDRQPPLIIDHRHPQSAHQGSGKDPGRHRDGIYDYISGNSDNHGDGSDNMYAGAGPNGVSGSGTQGSGAGPGADGMGNQLSFNNADFAGGKGGESSDFSNGSGGTGINSGEYVDSEGNVIYQPQKPQYQLPPLDLLQKPLQLKKSRIDKDITNTVKLLEQTLASFGVDVKVTQVSCGPAITRYELQPAKGVKVSRIVSLADDIALSLAASQVRIEAPIPGKAAVGIEVPNDEVSMVYFRDVLESKEFSNSKHSLVVALGKDIGGTTMVANLRDMPHLLVAGATGSGKSVCMNTLISSLLFRNTPRDLKLMLIDPKMVELTDYNGIPHLISPVVTEPKKAATALRWMVKEMEKRYEDFAKNGVRDIHRFNELASKSEDLEKLPYIVVLIDELADLMMVAPTDVEDCICRIAQMARAAGIHLVVATQRPSVDVITGLIKANIPSRIAFAVSSQTDSRTILDSGGAEKLLGKGDMLFHPVGAAKPIRIQGAYISDKEVESLVTFLKAQDVPKYEEDLINSQEETDQDKEEEMEDELLPKALSLCLEQGHASISLLQRRLHIGYNRAARLIDIMEAKGLIGPYEGSKPRTILSPAWEEYRAGNEEELE